MAHPVVCDVGYGACRPGAQLTPWIQPGGLNPAKSLHISILRAPRATILARQRGAVCSNGVAHVPAGFDPSNAATAWVALRFAAADLRLPPATTCVRPSPGRTSYTQPGRPRQAKLSVFVFEDDSIDRPRDAGSA